MIVTAVFVLLTWLSTGTGLAAQAGPTAEPGVPASPRVVAEIQQALDEAVRRFHAQDSPGVLAHVSDKYYTSPLTKRAVGDQLRALFALHDQVKARVRIDTVRMVGDHAWVFSTGEVTGRLRVVGSWVPLFSWERELEVARREDGRWRLFGYQQ